MWHTVETASGIEVHNRAGEVIFTLWPDQRDKAQIMCEWRNLVLLAAQQPGALGQAA